MGFNDFLNKAADAVTKVGEGAWRFSDAILQKTHNKLLLEALQVQVAAKEGEGVLSAYPEYNLVAKELIKNQSRLTQAVTIGAFMQALVDTGLYPKLVALKKTDDLPSDTKASMAILTVNVLKTLCDDKVFWSYTFVLNEKWWYAVTEKLEDWSSVLYDPQRDPWTQSNTFAWLITWLDETLSDWNQINTEVVEPHPELTAKVMVAEPAWAKIVPLNSLPSESTAKAA